MHIAIVSDNPAAANQLRFAVTTACSAAEVECLTVSTALEYQLSSPSGGYHLVFVVLPVDERETEQLLRRLRPLSPARLVGVGPTDSSRRILAAIRAGADDFLDELQDLRAQLTDILDRAPPPCSGGAVSGRSVSVCSAVGGGGATFVAANLALALSAVSAPVGAIDLNEESGDLASLFGLSPQHTLADLCPSQELLDQEMLVKSFSAHPSGVTLIASGPAGDELGPEHAAAPARVLQIARRLLPIVVADLSLRAAHARRVLIESDVVLLLLPLTFTAACHARRKLEDWRDAGLSAEKIIVVGNRCGQPGEVPGSQVAKLLGRTLDAELPEEVLGANLSVNCGNPILLEQPRAPLSEAISRLGQVVRQRLDPERKGEIPRCQQIGEKRSVVLARRCLQRATSLLACLH